MSLLGDIANQTLKHERRIKRKIRKLQERHPEQIATYTKFAQQSKVFSIIAFIFSPLSFLLTYLCMLGGTSNLGVGTSVLFIANIFLLLLGVVISVLPLIFAINSKIYAKAQIELNQMEVGQQAKKLTNWALGFAIPCSILDFIFAILILLKFSQG